MRDAALVRRLRAQRPRFSTPKPTDTVTTIEEIRGMVYAMRPPALDALGLVPALRQQALGLRNRAGETVAVDVQAPDDLPDLPATVEVAAYRIVVEALANVARRSDGPSASRRCASGPPSSAALLRPGPGPRVVAWPPCCCSRAWRRPRSGTEPRTPTREGVRTWLSSESSCW